MRAIAHRPEILVARRSTVSGRVALLTVATIAACLLFEGQALAAGCAGSPGCPYQEAAVIGNAPPAGHGVFRFPQAIAFSPGGSYVFVGDQYGGVVQKFDRNGVWQADIGGPSNSGELGRLGVLGGLATDRNGHLYVLDSQNDRVQVFDSASGAWLGAWGSTGAEAGRFDLGQNTGAGGIALHQSAALDAPLVYIADQLNHRVQRFTLSRPSSRDPASPVLPVGAAAAGQPDVVPAPVPDRVWGSFGDCSPRSCSQPGDAYLMHHPQGVAVNPQPDQQGRHDVYVADDDNHRVVEFAPDGTYLKEVGSFGTGSAQFRFPYDVGVDAGNFLYVADNNNHRVQKFNASDLGFLGLWGGFGSQAGGLEFPRALSALADDPLGGVYVADTANNRVQGFDPAGNQTASWGIAGRGPGYVSRPGAVAVDAAGTIYVADTFAHRIELLSASGAYLGQWGYVSARTGYAAPNTGNGQFNFPQGVALDRQNGNVWVADTSNNRVQALSSSGAWLATFGGLTSGDAPGQFSGPRGIAVDGSGNAFVADSGNNRVQRRDAASGQWSVVGLAGQSVSDPAAVTVDGRGHLYVADLTRVLDVGGGSAVALSPPAGGLDRPGGLWAAGTALYVSDTGNNRILRLDTATGQWTELGGDGFGVGSFAGPAGLATDAAGRELLIADGLNNRLQKLTFTTAPPQPPTAPRAAARAPARDAVAPRLRLTARGRQRALRTGRITVRATCDERCAAVGAGTLTLGKHRGASLRKARRTLMPRTAATLRLKLSRRARHQIRRALRRSRRAIAHVTVTARDRAGNQRSARRAIVVVG